MISVAIEYRKEIENVDKLMVLSERFWMITTKINWAIIKEYNFVRVI